MRVLIVDDHEKRRDAIKNLFAKYHCVVDVPDSVEDAKNRKKFKPENYDLIATPFTKMFARYSGVSVVQEPNRQDLNPAFDAVSRKHGHDSTQFVIKQGRHTLELDFMEREPRCLVNGENVKLSATELSILRTLALNRGHNVSMQDFLLQTGYSSNKDFGPKLYKLRKKISPIKIDTNGRKGLILPCRDAVIKPLVSRHGITIGKDFKVYYDGKKLSSTQLHEQRNLNNLTDLLEGQPVPRSGTNVDSIACIREALRTASVSEDAPEGLEFIETIDGQGYRLLYEPHVIQANTPDGLRFSLGERGDLVVDTDALYLERVDNGDRLSITNMEAHILEYLLNSPDDERATSRKIGAHFGFTNHDSANTYINQIRNIIRDLGLNHSDYISAGALHKASSGYRLINAQHLVIDDILASDSSKNANIPVAE